MAAYFTGKGIEMVLSRFIVGGVELKERWVDALMALPRIFGGLALSLSFGLGKFPVPERFVENMGALGFPLPALFAWAAVMSEVLGGFLLALGLLTRPSAFFIICTMLVAAFLQKADAGLSEKLPALFFLVISHYALIFGSGRFGLDALLRRRLKMHTSEA